MRSISDLLALNTPQQCTFTHTSDAGESAGTVYIANGSMRGDFTINTDGESMESHMIVKENTSYLWGAGLEQGIKMPLDQIKETQENAGHDVQTVDLDEKADYRCSSWPVNQNVFNLPSGIDFMDIGAMMESMMGDAMDEMIQTLPGEDLEGSDAMCAACDSVPAEARAQCLEAFGC
jgi:hypothetical protein